MGLLARKPSNRWLSVEPALPLQTEQDPSSLGEISDALVSCLPAVSLMKTQLADTVTQIEQAVVGVCDSFQDIAQRARDSVSKTETFLASRDSKDAENISVNQLIGQCQNTMGDLLGAIEDAGKVSRRAVEQMRKIDGYAATITASLKKLDEIAESNKVLALNARIEAARAGASGSGFAIVANEVNTQSQKSREVIQQVAGVAGHLREAADTAVNDLEQLNRHDQQNVEHSRQSIGTTLTSFQDLHQRMQQMLSEMSMEGELLANDISAAIRGLQFQDRASQRIHHVQDGMQMLHTELEKLSRGDLEGTKQVHKDILTYYTTREERNTAGVEDQSTPGEIELF